MKFQKFVKADVKANKNRKTEIKKKIWWMELPILPIFIRSTFNT